MNTTIVTAPSPVAPSSALKAPAPPSGNCLASSGSNDIRPDTCSMNRPMRSSVTCKRGACRTYCKPTRIAPTKRSPGSALSLRVAFQRRIVTKAATDTTALSANTNALPTLARIAPAIAGPTMRDTFIAAPLSPSAADSCERGTRAGTMAANTGQRIAIVMPFRKVSSSNSGADNAPASASAISSSAIVAAHSCVPAK